MMSQMMRLSNICRFVQLAYLSHLMNGLTMVQVCFNVLKELLLIMLFYLLAIQKITGSLKINGERIGEKMVT